MTDKETILLPHNSQPPIRCYRIHAYLFNILGINYPEFNKYVISNYLNLNNRGWNHPKEYLDFNIDNNFKSTKRLFWDNSWFDIIQIPDINKKIYSDIEIKEKIIEHLKKGYYILHYTNESCLSHTIHYKSDAFYNLIMIYGYDKTSDSFFALDYNYKRNFGTSQIPSKEYLSSLTSMHFSNYLNFIKAKKDLIFKFDYERSLRLIKCYINSENAYPNYEEYKINIFGYESVERSLHVMSDIGLNIISIRAIMEHKDIMMKYFNYIIENHFIDNKEIVDKYNNINKQMHIIFMKILKKEIANINSKNYLEEYDAIRKLNEKEAILLENYLKN